MDFNQIIEIGKEIYAYLEESGALDTAMEYLTKFLSGLVEYIFSLI